MELLNLRIIILSVLTSSIFNIKDMDKDKISELYHVSRRVIQQIVKLQIKINI